MLRIIALLCGILAYCGVALAQLPGGPGAQIPNSGGGSSTTFTGDCASSGSVLTCNVVPHPGYVAGRWYLPSNVNQLGGSIILGNAVIVCTYGAIARKVTINNLAIRVITLAAGGNIQVAAYANANGRPAALIISTASISTTATGVVTGAVTSKQLGPGGTDGGADVWWCLNADALAGGVGRIDAQANNLSPSNASVIGATSNTNLWTEVAVTAGVSCTGAACNGGSSAYNTWPASLAGSTWTDQASGNPGNALVGFFANSVP